MTRSAGAKLKRNCSPRPSPRPSYDRSPLDDPATSSLGVVKGNRTRHAQTPSTKVNVYPIASEAWIPVSQSSRAHTPTLTISVPWHRFLVPGGQENRQHAV
ncbi:hypothetical protein CVT26_007524 [Gymnopilus dilepis]|uniref:Uncharacterized protein n=1 Tax=Gymnopilus dilepis TaxID=231916 RepID=A0A409WI67_9AGAR|nr:hypothetical protein CVT26_007524 [Gymnopilus dilepis]